MNGSVVNATVTIMGPVPVIFASIIFVFCIFVFCPSNIRGHSTVMSCLRGGDMVIFLNTI